MRDVENSRISHPSSLLTRGFTGGRRIVILRPFELIHDCSVLPGIEGVASPNGAVMPVVMVEGAYFGVVQARGAWSPWSDEGLVGDRLYFEGLGRSFPVIYSGDWELGLGWAVDACLTKAAGSSLMGCGVSTGPFLTADYVFAATEGTQHVFDMGVDVSPGYQFGNEPDPEIQVGLRARWRWQVGIK
jgi:hypothetical protein